MIIFQGWGALVGLVGAGLIGLALTELTGSYAVSYSIAGITLTGFGFLFNVLGGENFRVFWVPIQYLGILVILGALLGSGQ